MSRRDSREAAIKIVFQNTFMEERLFAFDTKMENKEISEDINVENMINIYIEGISEEEANELDIEYIKDILCGVIKEITKIDNLIIKYSKDWTIDRMSKIDLAILRVAIYELLYKEDIPASVSINEAIEMAKKYSYIDAGAFINGILGSVYSESNT